MVPARAADVAFLCPVCAHTRTPAVRVGVIVVCGSCGASLVVSGDTVLRRARALDLEPLSSDDLKQLQAFRGQLAERAPKSA